MNYDCINLHFIDACNYSCKHCFVNKENRELSLDKIKNIIDKVSDYFASRGIQGRINLAGGEPLLSKNIDQIIDYIYSKSIRVSIITNGSLLTEDFIKNNCSKIESIGISVDSLIDSTNMAIGRNFRGKTLSKDELINKCKWIKENGIKLKINTCVSGLNVNEDFNGFLDLVKPDRYKILQMLIYDDNLMVNKAKREELKEFVKKHKRENTVFESADELNKSYVIIDSSGCLSTNNLHQSKFSVFENDIADIIDRLDVDYKNYLKRYI